MLSPNCEVKCMLTMHGATYVVLTNCAYVCGSSKLDVQQIKFVNVLSFRRFYGQKAEILARYS